MQRRNRFITAVVTAALTFGVLTLTLGQRHYNGWQGGHHGYGHHHDDCNGDHGHHKQKQDAEHEL